MDASTQWWTPEQDRILIDHPRASHDALARMVSEVGPVRSRQAVKERRERLAMSKARDAWSDPKRVARLAELHGKGYSGGQIAKVLSAEFDASFSRNAIIGKVHRLGLAKPSDEARGREGYRVTARLRSKQRDLLRKPPKPTPQARAFQHGGGCPVDGGAKPPLSIRTVGATPESLNVPMWDDRFKPGCCKYATEERDGVHMFCCAKAVAGTPYCRPHLAAVSGAGSSVTPSLPKSDRVAKAPPADDGEPQPLDFEADAA